MSTRPFTERINHIEKAATEMLTRAGIGADDIQPDVQAFVLKIVRIADTYPDYMRHPAQEAWRNQFTADQRLAWTLRFGVHGQFLAALKERCNA